MSKAYTLWVHDEKFSEQDLVLVAEHFPHVRVGDTVEISQQQLDAVLPPNNNPAISTSTSTSGSTSTSATLAVPNTAANAVATTGTIATNMTSTLNTSGNTAAAAASTATSSSMSAIGSIGSVGSISGSFSGGLAKETGLGSGNNSSASLAGSTSAAANPNRSTAAAAAAAGSGSASSSSSSSGRRLFLKVPAIETAKTGTFQISIAKHIADLYGFQARRTCYVELVDVKDIALDFVQISFRDQYVGRSDLWRLWRSMLYQCIYESKRVAFAGIRAQVKTMFRNEEVVSAGCVTENTKAIFRSESAKFLLFIQMSREMWSFDEDGQLYIEKALDGFLPELFERWNSMNHLVSIILFSRVYYDAPPDPGLKIPALMNRGDRYYQDFYKTITEFEVRSDWRSVVVEIKRDLANYQQQLFMRNEGDSVTFIGGEISTASEGNFLEANNLALNIFEKHYVNRDLSRTGLGIVVVTPGNGSFKVDPVLQKLTKRRMIDNGIGCDVVCLGRPPLHVVPLFQLIDSATESSTPPEDGRFRQPHWIDISYYSRPTQNRARPFRGDQFVPRCRMYEIQMGIVECDENAPLPLLHPPDIELDSNMVDDADKFAKYDKSLFGKNRRRAKSRWKSSSFSSHSDLKIAAEEGVSKARPSIRKNRFSIRNRSESMNGDERDSRPNFNDVVHASAVALSRESSRWDGEPGSPKSAYNNPMNSSDDSADESGSEDDSSFLSSYVYSASMPLTALTLDLVTNRKPHLMKSRSRLQDGKAPTRAMENPFNPMKNPSKLSSYRRRWYHAFPISPSNASSSGDSSAIGWQSLCTPACLPLTTDYVPTPEELDSKYKEFTYALTPNEDTSPYHNKSELLYGEIISQRLAQGFQYIVNGQPSTGSVELALSKIPNPLFLSIGNHFHQLTLQTSTGNIEVRRYERTLRKRSESINYKYSLWTKNQSFYDSRSLPFHHVELQSFNWNNLDNLICDQFSEADLPDFGKFWQVRLVLVPMKPMPPNILKFLNLASDSEKISDKKEKFTDEEVRIKGFLKFTEVFDKSQKTIRESKPLQFNINPSGTVSYVSNETVRVVVNGPSANDSKGRTLSRDSPMEAIGKALQADGTGVSIQDRRWHLRLYKKCLIGSELVDWLMANIQNVDTREDAVSFGNELMQAGLIQHVRSGHQFLDGIFFYQIGEISKRWQRVPNAEEPATQQRVNIELSKAIVLDVDPNKKSDRPEWAVLHYDTIYNPSHCYHLHLYWLVATGRLINDLIIAWQRRAQQCGLRLVEAPITQSKLHAPDHPFRTFTIIKLALPPPSIEGLHLNDKFDDASATYFEHQLLSKFDFVLDMEADSKFSQLVNPLNSYPKTSWQYTQYIHREGVAIVQLLEPGNGFLWENNSLYIRRNPSSNLPAIFGAFKEFCSSEAKLHEFYNEILATVIAAPEEHSDDEKDDSSRRRSSRSSVPSNESTPMVSRSSSVSTLNVSLPESVSSQSPTISATAPPFVPASQPSSSSATPTSAAASLPNVKRTNEKTQSSSAEADSSQAGKNNTPTYVSSAASGSAPVSTMHPERPTLNSELSVVPVFSHDISMAHYYAYLRDARPLEKSFPPNPSS